MSQIDHLAVLAEPSASAPKGATVLRFAGIPSEGESVVPKVAAVRDEVASQIKERFSSWLYGWARQSGVLHLATWNYYSWWWYAPISERSPLRSAIIPQLHQLLVFRNVLRLHHPKRVTWFADATLLRTAALRIAAAEGCTTVEFKVSGSVPRNRRRIYAAGLRVYAFFVDMFRWLLFRLTLGRLLHLSPQLLFASRFPILWERTKDAWTERMFGRLPELFAEQSRPLAYAALPTGTPVWWLRNIRIWRGVMLQSNIIPYHLGISLAGIFAVHATIALWCRYLRIRGRLIRSSAIFEGIDITELLLRELDLNMLDPEIPASRLIASGLANLLGRFTSVHTVFHPYEFQPSEHAIKIAALTRQNTKVIGLQTGVYTSGQLGFLPNVEEFEGVKRDGTRVPMPDLIVTYGRLMTDMYIKALGKDRVLEAGALRYGTLARLLRLLPDRNDTIRKLDLPLNRRIALVACPSMPEEAWPIVRSAIKVAEADPDLYVVFKFHYHYRLDDQIADIAGPGLDGCWRVADTGLHDLIIAADIVITGATSVAYEALALGRPTAVYLQPAKWHCNPATQTPLAFQFWDSDYDLRRLIQQILTSEVPVSDDVRTDALADQLNLRPDGEALLLAALAFD